MTESRVPSHVEGRSSVRTKRSSQVKREGLHDCNPLQHTRSFESFGSVRPLSHPEVADSTAVSEPEFTPSPDIGALTTLYLRSIGSGHEATSVQYSEAE